MVLRLLHSCLAIAPQLLNERPLALLLRFVFQRAASLTSSLQVQYLILNIRLRCILHSVNLPLVISLHIPSEIQNSFSALLQELSFSALLLPLDELGLRVDGEF